MTREQLLDLIKSHSKYFTEDGTADDVATVRYNEFADAILALPIEVPGDEEMLNKAIDHNRTGKYTMIDYYSTGFVEGARWACSEIIKRNRP